MRASSIFLSVTAALSTVLPVFAAPINPVSTDGIGSSSVANDAGQVQSDEKMELQSFPAIIVAVSSKLDDLLKQLGGVVDGKVGVAFGTIDPILEEVCQVLSEAVAEVTNLVEHPTEEVLALEGKVLSTADVANLVSGLIHIVIAIITAAINAVGTAQLYLLTPVITTISGQLAAIVSCAIKLVQDTDFLVVLKSLIQDVATFIVNTNSLSSLSTALHL